ncbi:MAG: ABC transporter permease [Bacteroidales bacterium]|nr:ABC transporter permease [Bacteroidales bacterium]
MFKNYLFTAVRNILRNKTFSLVNILGLATGIATAIIIFLWIQYETGYSKSFAKHKVLHLAYLEYNYPTGNKYSGVTSTALGPALKRQYPEIIDFARTTSRQWVIGTESKRFQSIGTPVDPSFFNMFSMEFILGDPQQLFKDVNEIVLSESLAKKIFGNENPINKLITIEDWYEAKVTGVYKDLPENTHFYSLYDFFVPFEIINKIYGWGLESWDLRNYKTFIQLNSGKISASKLQEKIGGIVRKHQYKSNAVVKIMPITKIHLQNLEGGGLINYIYIMAVVAVFILLIAFINYINLSTASSATRSKEIGMRKVIGADRKKLIIQFLSESIFLSFIAVLFAIALVKLSLPYINDVLDIKIKFTFSAQTIAGLIGFGIITGIVAGVYPALILSKFNSILALKGALKSKAGHLVFRRVLVVFQFFLSIIVIIGTITINRQIKYILNKDLGYHKENIICMDLSSSIAQNYRTIVAELLASPYILNVCPSNTTLDSWESSMSANAISWSGQDPGQIIPVIGILGVGFDFRNMYELTMVEGRFFSREFQTDIGEACVVNETAVRDMGFIDPIGKTIKVGDMERKIIGVVKNFHFTSLHERIEPLCIMLGWAIDNFSMRIDKEHTAEAIDFTETVLKEIIPSEPFEYKFLEQNVRGLYRNEERIKTIMQFSSGLAIFISCMGLFGLVLFVVERRTKEIGIRKVHGASIYQIINLLVIDFVKWVFIASVLAIPVSYYLSDNWLNSFAYRINLSWWFFAFAALLVIALTVITVSFQSISVALKKPVNTLKYE